MIHYRPTEIRYCYYAMKFFKTKLDPNFLSSWLLSKLSTKTWYHFVDGTDCLTSVIVGLFVSINYVHSDAQEYMQIFSLL